MPIIDHRPRALSNKPGNEAGGYGVTVSKQVYVPSSDKFVDLNPGQQYYDVILAYHLTPEENRGGHYVYVDLLTGDHENPGSPILCRDCIGYRWENGMPLTASPDKAWATEPMGNVTMFGETLFSVWVKGSFPSRMVKGLTAVHPDEGPGNTIGHHSFYVIFQRRVYEGEAPPPPSDTLKAAMLIEPRELVVPGNVSLQDFSTGNPTSWHWQVKLQSGGTPLESRQQHPSITITQAGRYDVTLTVTRDGATDSETFTGAIVANQPSTQPVPEIVGTFEVQHGDFGRGELGEHVIYRDKPTGFGCVPIALEREAMKAALVNEAYAGRSYLTFYLPVNKMTRQQAEFMEETPELD